MKPPLETVRVSQQGRERLILLKRITGIEHWNTLCRWAVCVSLRESSQPPNVSESFEGGVEIAWKVFAGELSDVINALIRQRAVLDGLGAEDDAAAACLRAHLHRGLGYLTSEREIDGIAGFCRRWIR